MSALCTRREVAIFSAARTFYVSIMTSCECQAKLLLLEYEIKELKRAVNLLQRKRNESYYQKIVANHLGGGHIHVANAGISDVTTKNEHAEVKKWSQAHHAVGQLLSYNSAMRREKLSVYFYGPIPSSDRYGVVLDLCSEYDIHVYSIDEDDDGILEHKIVQPEILAPGINLEESVKRFVKGRLVKDVGHNLPWTKIKEAFTSFYGDKIGVDKLREQFKKHGLHFAETSHVRETPDSEVLKNFKGYRYWKLVPFEKKEQVPTTLPESDTVSLS